MSAKERRRLEVLGRVRDGQLGLSEAAELMGVSYRQARRLRRRYRTKGDAGLVHGLRGRPGNRGVKVEHKAAVLAAYEQYYEGFGPQLASEQLLSRQALTVSPKTLRTWLIEAGLWKAVRKVRRHRRRRPRKASFGELVQIDGSHHAWFEDRGPACCLMVMVDDATGWTWARFFEEETTAAAMTVLREWIERHGVPRRLYPDRHSIWRVNGKEAQEIEHRTGKRPLTQMGRALGELGIGLTCANSPQAKGRVERAHGTLQDRLVKLLRLEGIGSIEAANAYLQEKYLPDHNARFAAGVNGSPSTPPAELDNLHVPLPLALPPEAGLGLDDVLCVKEPRVVGRDGCVSYEGKAWQLHDTGGKTVSPVAVRQVMIHHHLDGRLEARSGNRRFSLHQPPCHEPPPKASLVERVDKLKGQAKPASDHPWRHDPLSPPASQGRGRSAPAPGSSAAAPPMIPSPPLRGPALAKRTVLLRQ